MARIDPQFSRWIRMTVVLLGVSATVVLWRPAAWTPLRVLGACLIVCALALWFTAQVQLGDSFSVKPEARKLVTRGIYSRIRNPIYVASVVLFLGIGLYSTIYWWLALMAIAIPLQIVRARREAKVLEERFGEEYRLYRAKTWF
jgi:protein-S-isoprenylcysteine O-methyltransferase Ste14